MIFSSTLLHVQCDHFLQADDADEVLRGKTGARKAHLSTMVLITHLKNNHSRKEYQEYLQEKLSQDDAAQAEKRKLEDCDEMESKCSTQLRTTKQRQDFLTNQSSLRSYFHSKRIVHQETGTLKRKSGQREKSGSISKNCWSTRMDHWSSVPNVESTSHVDLPRPAMGAQFCAA